MLPERAILGSLSSAQDVWLAHFPGMHRRAQWHIVHHLCISGGTGVSVGALHGLVKQVFLLDDATVKERVAELVGAGLCATDEAPGSIAARTVVVPTDALRERFEAFLTAFGTALREWGDAVGPMRGAVLHRLDRLAAAWSAMLDAALAGLPLSPARRLEAKRHLLSVSHATILRAVLQDALDRPDAHDASGLLADQIAARLFDVTAQNFHTTRDHIAFLMATGLLRRRSGRSLRVALSPDVLGTVVASLRAVADRSPTEERSRIAADETMRLPADDPVAHIIVTGPGTARRRYTLMAAPLVVGRAPSCDIVLDAPDVSRIHCRIEPGEAHALVADAGSRNGTFVDGVRIATPAPLRPGGVLAVGHFRLEYQTVRAGAAVPEQIRTSAE